MTEAVKRIVLVGHCGPDSYALKSAVGNAVPGAAVQFANDSAALSEAMAGADLLLINRVLDGRFDVGGIDLIRRLSGKAGGPALMLVSNYADAQAAAEAAGAVPGFGKAEMNTEEAKRRLRSALGA